MALRDIRRRIKSVKNTAQITKAMQLVASSKMRKAQQLAVAGKPYAALLNEVIGSLQGRVGEEIHPLLAPRDGDRHLVLYISTNKGLCGGLNTNLSREALALPKDTTQFVSCGRKGTQTLVRGRRNLVADFELREKIIYTDTKRVAEFLVKRYLDGECDKVSVLFTNFVSTLVQKPTLHQLLPIVKLEAVHAGLTQKEQAEESSVLTGGSTEYLFEPGPRQMLDYALPQYLEFQVYQMFLEANASEHSARMVAMKSATDNAKQIIKDLTLEYNRERQAGITREILEIATAQAAMS